MPGDPLRAGAGGPERPAGLFPIAAGVVVVLGVVVLAALQWRGAPAPPERTATSRAGAGGAAREADSRPPARPLDLSDAFRRAERIRPLTSLVISRDGEILGEEYYHGGSAGEPVNVKSVSKSVLSALVGIAIAEGHLEGTDQPAAEILEEDFRRLDDPRKRHITVGHLLSMQAGLQTTSFGNYGAWVSSGDWIRWALARPLECPPGGCWEYSTGNYHLLSALLTEATRMDTRTYARRALLAPLDVRARPWDRGPRGYYLGGNNMAFTPRELLRLGELYLNGGRWDGRQIVPSRWIERSWSRHVVSPWNGYDYGYGWWGRRLGGEPVWFAWGYGGQYLFLFPRLDAAVVTTTEPERERGPRDADWAIFELLRDEVVPEMRWSAPGERPARGGRPGSGEPEPAPAGR